MTKAEAGGTPRGSGYKRRKDFRRSEILAAARILLEEDGAAAVTIARIASAAGISDATVYKYFANKQDLIGSVLREWLTPFVQRLQSELAPLREMRPQLVLIAIRFLRSMEETPKLHRVFFQEIRWSEYHRSMIRDLNRIFSETVINALNIGVESGEIYDNIDVRTFRDMLFGGLEHIAMRTSFSGKPINVEKEAEAYIDMMLLGVRIRSDARSPNEEFRRFSRLIDRMEERLDR